MINIDTLSEISIGRDSMNRFSLGSEITNTNSYRILFMNVRNVFEKKMLNHLMQGFNSIKYCKSMNQSSEISKDSYVKKKEFIK